MADPKDFRNIPKYDALLGRVRPTDREGIDITEQVKHSMKVTVSQWFKDVIGKFTPVDSEGKELTLDNLTAILNEIKGLTSRSKTVSCPVSPIEIPGILAGDAFDAGDCFGTLFSINVPKSGVIYSATFWDLDDEGSQIDLEVFKQPIPQIASDAAWAPTDAGILHFIAELNFYAFDDHGSCQTSEIKNIGKAYTAPDGKLWVQAVCRSTPNIAASNMPKVQLQILSDDPTWQES